MQATTSAAWPDTLKPGLRPQVLDDVTTKGLGWIELSHADAPHTVVVKAKMETSRMLSVERYRELWERTHVYNKGHLVECDLRHTHLPLGPRLNDGGGGGGTDREDLCDPTNALRALQL
jgi:hypothetical protein